jgi:hypothetical protein
MALLGIHLWGKFWMAAWRGKRTWTWITGVVAFAASVVECFTGYVSQSNFDSQWISASAKDAFNSVGVGAFFDVMNFGQMLLRHVVLVPIVLVAGDERWDTRRHGPMSSPGKRSYCRSRGTPTWRTDVSRWALLRLGLCRATLCPSRPWAEMGTSARGAPGRRRAARWCGQARQATETGTPASACSVVPRDLRRLRLPIGSRATTVAAMTSSTSHV